MELLGENSYFMGRLSWEKLAQMNNLPYKSWLEYHQTFMSYMVREHGQTGSHGPMSADEVFYDTVWKREGNTWTQIEPFRDFSDGAKGKVGSK